MVFKVVAIIDVFLAIEHDMRVSSYADLDSIFAQRSIARAYRLGRATRRHHEPERSISRKIHFVGDNLKETGDSGFGIAVKIGAHGAEIDAGGFVADFYDNLVAGFVHKRARVIDPSAKRGAV